LAGAIASVFGSALVAVLDATFAWAFAAAMFFEVGFFDAVFVAAFALGFLTDGLAVAFALGFLTDGLAAAFALGFLADGFEGAFALGFLTAGFVFAVAAFAIINSVKCIAQRRKCFLTSLSVKTFGNDNQ
jgi:hypothetical protein